MAGRKRSPLTGSGAQAELAQRFRDLRDASGLTLRQLAAKSGYSSGTLSQAESGRTVPSWDLVAAFVQTCGEDPVQWRHRWELAQAAPAASAQSVLPLPEPAHPGYRGRPGPEPAPPAPAKTPARWPRQIWIAGTAAVVIAASAVVIAASAAVMRSPAGPPPQTANLVPTRPSASFRTGARDDSDPYADGCKRDERQLNAEKVYRQNGHLFGTIVLVYSAICQAEWGYLDAPNSTAWTVHINTYRIPGPGATRWHFSGHVGYGSWGNVLSTRPGCVYAEAYVVDKDGEGPHALTACIKP